MACILNGTELTLSGWVGDYFFEDGFSLAEIVSVLARIEDSEALTIFLNSGGGYASEGAAIHALLSRRPGQTDIVVEGIAASAASLIAMAGDTVTMSLGSVMMIHDPSDITWGDAAEHERSVEMLNSLGTAYARVYAAKSGKTADECRVIMQATRWMAPEEAVLEGFADAVGTANAKPVAAFDYREYDHAPKRLTAMAKKRGWEMPANDDAPKRATASTKRHSRKEDDMSGNGQSGGDAGQNDANATELAELRAFKKQRETSDAIMALPEAKGRESQARALADNGVAVDAAKAVLAATPAAPEDVEETDGPTAEQYAQTRMQNHLAQPGGASANRRNGKADTSVLHAAVDRTNKATARRREGETIMQSKTLSEELFDRAGHYLVRESNGYRSREQGTLASGSGRVKAGTVLGTLSSSGEYAPLDPAAEDGSETASDILYEGRDTTDAAQRCVVTARDTEVHVAVLHWPDGITNAQKIAALASLEAKGIIGR